MSKSNRNKKQNRTEYLTTGLLLSGVGIFLIALTFSVTVCSGTLFIGVLVLAAVLLLIGSGSLLKWILGDRIEWD